MASTACPQRRRFREAVAKANELHAIGDLFAKQIEPEPAPEDPLEWPMAEESEDEDDAPMPDAPAPPELELIDMPNFRCPTWSGAPHSALLLVYGAGPC